MVSVCVGMRALTAWQWCSLARPGPLQGRGSHAVLFSHSGAGVRPDHHHRCGGHGDGRGHRLPAESLQGLHAVLHQPPEPEQEAGGRAAAGECGPGCPRVPLAPSWAPEVKWVSVLHQPLWFGDTEDVGKGTYIPSVQQPVLKEMWQSPTNLLWSLPGHPEGCPLPGRGLRHRPARPALEPCIPLGALQGALLVSGFSPSVLDLGSYVEIRASTWPWRLGPAVHCALLCHQPCQGGLGMGQWRRRVAWWGVGAGSGEGERVAREQPGELGGGQDQGPSSSLLPGNLPALVEQ